MSTKMPSSCLSRTLLIAALVAPLLMACGKEESGSSMPSGSAAQQPASPPMTSTPPAPPTDPTPPAATPAPTPPAGESTSTPPAAPASGSEPAK